MKKILKTIGSLCVLTIIFLNAYSASAEVDTTKIGVSVNDEFTFVINEYTDFFGLFDGGLFLGFSSDFDELLVYPGDEFTLKVTDTDVVYDEFFETYDLGVEFSNSSMTVDSTNDMGEFGSWVIFNDWSYWDTLLSEDEDYANVDNTIGVDGDEFVAKAKGEDTRDGTTAKVDTEIRYDADTGVLLYLHEDIKLSMGELNIDILNEYVKKGYTPPENGNGDDSGIPGFELSIAIASIMLIPLIRKRKIVA